MPEVTRMRTTVLLVTLPLTVVIASCSPREPPQHAVAAPPVPSAESSAPAASASAPPVATIEAPAIADAGVVAAKDAAVALCPVSFVVAQTDRGCRIGDAECSYPEGTCQCDGFPRCGGAMMQLAVKGQAGQLKCAPKSPQTLRVDGCTFATPVEGSSCGKAARTCVYGACAWNQTTATCAGGTWKLSHYTGPPPP
jgi:hypothetical protein